MSYNIKPSDLPKIWSAPDNTRLISKQISVRLPIHVAAKIFALEKLYTNKTRTQLINDLLASALEGMGEGLPSEQGKFLGEMPSSDGGTEPVYEDVGMRAQYYKLVNQFLYDLEREAGNDGEIPQFDPVITEKDQKNIQLSKKK